MNLFILGKVTGSYRTQNFIKCIMDHTDNCLYLDGFVYQPKSIFKLLRFVSKAIHELSQSLCNLYNLFMSDAVYVCAMNHHNRLFKFAYLMKKPILTEYYISQYDTFVNDRKTVKNTSLKAKYLMKVDRRALTKSDVVIFLNESEANYYSSIAEVNLQLINYRIIPLCVNERVPAGLPYFNKNTSHINLCWWGTYIPLHGLDKILLAMQFLKKIGFPCRLYMFGDSDIKAAEYLSIIKEYGINDIVFVNNDYTFKNGKLEEFLMENCDIVLGTFGDSEKAKSVIANKIVDGIAMQAPVITGYSRALTEYFNGKDDIFLINNSAEVLAEKVIEVANMSTTDIHRCVKKAHQVYCNNFSVQIFNNRILKLLSDLEKMKEKQL